MVVGTPTDRPKSIRSRCVIEVFGGVFSAPEPKTKCTIVIMCCPSSVRRPSLVVVNFSHIRLLLWNRLSEFNKTRQEARYQRPLPSFCFSGRSEKQDGCPSLWLAVYILVEVSIYISTTWWVSLLWTRESPRAHVAKFYGCRRLIRSVWEHQNCLCYNWLKL